MINCEVCGTKLDDDTLCPNCESNRIASLETARDIYYLTKAADHAAKMSVCAKAKVGAVIIDQHQRLVFGANRAIPNHCWGLEDCQRDGHCVSTIHAEIDAIVGAKRDLHGATIYVTRYPCEACAKAIVTAGISTVIYGRPQPICADVMAIFDEYNIRVRHVPSYEEYDAAYGTKQ